MKKILGNPNYVYILAFIVPFIVYTLEWSTLYPPLTINLFLFYFGTFAAALVLGLILHKTRPFCYSQIAAANTNTGTLLAIFVLYGLEVAYSRTVPLLEVFAGTYVYGEDTFGIPVLHTFLVSFNTFYAIYLFHQYLSSRSVNIFWLFVLSNLPFILLVTRSSILNILLGAFIVFLVSRERLAGRVVLKSVALVLLVFYLFGFLGNQRSAGGDPTFIPKASGATDEFLDSAVPKEFYWSYLYIASPVANLQNNINKTQEPQGGYKRLIRDEFLPTFLTKFITAPQPKEFYQINPFLNVGTIYVYTFSFAGWWGMIFMFFYLLLIINGYYLLVIRSDRFRVTGLAILYNVIIFATFHNTIAYSAQSLQLLYPVVFSMLFDYLERRNGSGITAVAPA
ncbi:MAG TPA: hypothetical protein VGE15_04195 [Sphingobacteriaceae bacterium]